MLRFPEIADVLLGPLEKDPIAEVSEEIKCFSNVKSCARIGGLLGPTGVFLIPLAKMRDPLCVTRVEVLE